MDEVHYSQRSIRSFVVRSSRFTKGQAEDYKQLSANYLLKYQNLDDQLTQQQSFWKNYTHKKTFVCEIGFGTGGSTWQIAQNQRDTFYLGIEVYRSGIAHLMRNCAENSISNLRIIEHDAIEVLHNMLPCESLDALHIFFPDPWPKKRHQKRRLVNKQNIALFKSSLKKNGYLYFVSDWQDYAEEVRQLLANDSWLLEGRLANGFSEAQPWRPQSKFELKAQREGRPVYELFMRKVLAKQCR